MRTAIMRQIGVPSPEAERAEKRVAPGLPEVPADCPSASGCAIPNWGLAMEFASNMSLSPVGREDKEEREDKEAMAEPEQREPNTSIPPIWSTTREVTEPEEPEDRAAPVETEVTPSGFCAKTRHEARESIWLPRPEMPAFRVREDRADRAEALQEVL